MYLSKLQKYILLECYFAKKRKYSRQGLVNFYNKIKNQPKKEDQQRIITQSIERLINRELLIGFGEKTPHKWYITEIRLMPKGKVVAKKLLGEQRVLPFKLAANR